MIGDAMAKELINAALEGRKNAYAPYSGYTVGAAILTERGEIFSGCNVENASYGATICAERVAICSAVAAGQTGIKALAVIGGRAEERDEMSGEAAPCGVCRQVLREFTDPADCDVVIAKSTTNYRIFKLNELLPESFGPEKLK